MYSDWVGPAVAGFLTLWLGVLSFLLWKETVFLESLFPKSGSRDIRRKFEEVLQEISDFRQDLEKLKDKVSEIEKLGLKYIQRVELLRYNPYDDTGGDQSFSLALLDDKGDGFVVTSLHARSGTRVFAKPVCQGQANKYRLSEEERQVVERAMDDRRGL